MKISKLLMVVLVAASSLGLSVEPNTQTARASVVTAQAPKAPTVTKIRVHGLFAATFLIDSGTNGALNASHDQLANTSGLDFSWGYPDPTNPDQAILIQGSGDIPNSALTLTSTSAHLAVTTMNSSSFIINRCILNIVIGTFHCDPGAPKTFDLTWTKNGFGSVVEKTTRRETRGPVTTKFQGGFTSVSATVTGTWDGHTSVEPNEASALQDTQSTTIIREITVEPNP